MSKAATVVHITKDKDKTPTSGSKRLRNLRDNHEKELRRTKTEAVEENKAVKSLKKAATLTMPDSYNSARNPRCRTEINKIQACNKPQGESVLESNATLKCRTENCDFHGVVEKGTTEFLCNYCTANSRALSKSGKEPELPKRIVASVKFEE